MILLDVKLLDCAKLPTKATEGSAAFDLYSPKEFILYPQSYELIDLKIQIGLREGTCGILSHRSGMNSKGIFAYGLIDSDYRGNLKVTLYNFSDEQYVIQKHDRIAQLKIEEIPTVILREVQELSETTRKGGHGSSGR